MLWHKALEEVPEGPAIILANEFFDALPVHQAIKQEDGWHERVVTLDSNGNFTLDTLLSPMSHLERLLPPRVRDAPPGSIFEWRTDSIALEIGRRVARHGGAALVIDYGHIETEIGDTLQAVGEHAYANPLLAPGMVDLTAHVDFQSLAQAAESIGARVHGPLQQGKFLRRLGIETRAATLKAKAPPDKISEIEGQVERLTGSGAREMGMLFKVLGSAIPSSACCRDLSHDAAGEKPLGAWRHPACFLHARRRRVGRALCEPQCRRRIRGRFGEGGGKSHAHGEGDGRDVGALSHRLSNPFARRGGGGKALARRCPSARRRHRHARRPGWRSASPPPIAGRCYSPIRKRALSAPPMPAGAARFPGYWKRRSPPWSGWAPRAAASLLQSAR